MLRPGIPLSPFLVTHTKPYLFYACGNVIFKFSVDVAGSAEFCGKNDTCHSGTVRSISHSGDELLTCGDDKILAILDHGLSCLRRRCAVIDSESWAKNFRLRTLWVHTFW